MTTLPVFYRLREVYVQEDGDVALKVETWHAIKETRCGYWVVPAYAASWWKPSMALAKARKNMDARWVSKTTQKRLCYPTRAEALASFRARKAKQVRILRSQLAEAELCNWWATNLPSAAQLAKQTDLILIRQLTGQGEAVAKSACFFD